MNLLRFFFIVALSLVSPICFGLICVNASANYEMFGSALTNKTLAYSARRAFADRKFTAYKIYSAKSDVQLARIISQMAVSKCNVILGLITSRDCLTAGPILKKDKIIGLSPACADQSITDFSPFVYTASPVLSKYIKKLVEYLNQKSNIGKIYVVYKPDSLFSIAALQSFRTLMDKKFLLIPVSAEGVFDPRLLKSLKNSSGTIVFLIYSLLSAQVLVNLSSHHLIGKRTNIIGSPSWAYDVGVFRLIKPILAKARTVLSLTSINSQTVERSKFAKDFSKKYHRKPLEVEALNYDVTGLAVHCYRYAELKGAYQYSKFIRCINSTRYSGITGQINFRSSIPFAIRTIHLINFFK